MKRLYTLVLLLLMCFAGQRLAAQIIVIDAIDFRVALEQNYPNPSVDETNIPFTISQKSKVTLEVYNIVGVKVITVVDKELDAGEHEFKLDTRNLKNGMYIYRLTAGKETAIRRMKVAR